MTLRLAIEISASAAGAKKGIGEARAEVAALDEAASAAARQVDALGEALQGEAGASSEAATKRAKATQALRDEAQAASEAARTLDALAQVERRASAPVRAPAAITPKPVATPSQMPAPANDPGTADPERVRRMRAELIPLVQAEDDHAKALAKVREAERIGALNAHEAEVQVTRLNAAYKQTTERLQAMERQGGTTWKSLRPDQKMGIARQVPDIVGSLGMGMSFGQVAMQQGPQIVDQAGGVGASLGLLKSVITPVTATLGLMTAAVVAGGLAWSDYAGRTKQATDVARAFGGATGTTAADIEKAANSASAAGTASVSVAREIATELTRTGKVGAEQFGDLIGVTRNFAAVMQTDVATAANKLGTIIGDPATGAAQLRQMGLLDGATQRLVQRLAEQNRTQEASRVLLTALEPRIAGAADATTAWGRAWDTVARSASNAWTAIGKAVDRATGGGTDEDRLAELRARLQRPTVAGRLQGSFSRQRDQAEAAELEARIKARADKAEADRKRAEDDRRGSAAVTAAAASPANAELRERIRLEAQLQQLLDGQSASNLTTAEQSQIADAIEATRRALDGLATAKERQAQLDRMDLQIQAERDPVARANLVAERERIRLSGEQITSAKAVAEVERARTKSLEDSAAAARLSTRTIVEGYQQQEEAARLSLRMVNASPAAQARAQAELQARQQAIAEGLKPDSADAQERVAAAARAADAASRLQAAQAARSLLNSQRDQLEQARLELTLMGQSEAVRARTVALLQAEQQIRSQLIDTNSREAATIRAQAVALADLGTLRSRQSDAWQTFTSAGEQAFDAISQNLISNGDAFKNWGDIVKSVTADITSTLLKLAVLNPLKNALFGTNYGTLSDLQGGGGGLLGALFGGGKSAAAAGMTGSGAGGGMAVGAGAGVLALSRSYTGLNEVRDNSAIRSILSASGTAALDPAKQAWCAAYANAVLAKSGMAGTGSNLASSFLSWGQATNNPSLGDIVNIKPQTAGSSGHVGFFAGRDAAGNVLVSGGNQGNGVSTAAFPSDQVLSFRTSLTDATAATGSFANGLGDAARTATGALGGASGGLGGAATDLGGAAGDVGTAATSFSSGLGNAFETILSGLGDALGGIGKGFSGLFSGFGGGTVGATAGASFALGGIMTSAGPLPLRAYSNGGVANSPQLALYGEGRSPEAYVPLPDGRSIPVSLRVSGGEAQAQAAPVTVNVINNAGAQVRTQTSVGRGGELQLNILVDAMRQIVAEDARDVGPMTQTWASRFGVSPAGGLA